MEQPDFKRVSVIGLGYIGLPTPHVGVKTTGRRCGCESAYGRYYNRGEVHIVEPDLDSQCAEQSQGYLTATTIPEPADAFLHVPTPFGTITSPIRFIEAAARSIVRF